MATFWNNAEGTWSDEPVRQLLKVLPSCFLVDSFFIIRAVSSPVADLVGHSPDRLVGEPMSFLCPQYDIAQVMQLKLAHGYFNNFETTLRKSNKDEVHVILAGFRSNLIIENCPYSVISVQSVHDPNLTEVKLRERTRQLEALLNCAWHDLRGPIATIKGVINVANMRKDDTEINLYLKWIEDYTERLDQALRKLLATVQFINKENT